MLIPRQIEPSIRNYARKFPILSLTGPRQAGKTTLLRHVFTDYEYVSLENPDTRLFAEEDPRGFLDRYSKYIILDEAQRVPALFNYLQAKVDTDRLMGQYILSGSQNFLLIESITQSLAGRVALFKLFPFDLHELQQVGLLNKSLEETIVNGTYPALIDRDLLPTEYYPNYIETYVERDVRSLINIKDLSVFRMFIRLCAGRVGQLLNASSLATECGVSPKTIQAWLSILEASHIIFLLSPYYQNINKRVVKSPKLYFYDTGLLSYMLSLSAQDLPTYYAKGNIFENFIIANLFRTNAHQGVHTEMYFYRDSNQNEVDLLLRNKLKLDLLEIKSGKTFSKDFLKGMNVFESHFPELAGSKTMIYAGDNSFNYLATQVMDWKTSASLLVKPA